MKAVQYQMFFHVRDQEQHKCFIYMKMYSIIILTQKLCSNPKKTTQRSGWIRTHDLFYQKRTPLLDYIRVKRPSEEQ